MLELLMGRRSIRKYQEKKIDKNDLDYILQGALTSPASRGVESCEIIVIDDPLVLEKLGASRGPQSKPISNAPMALVVISDTENTDVYVENSSIMAIIIQLLAASLGLGSCWIQVRDRFTADNESVDAYVRDLLDIPENYKVECMISLGYPAEEKEAYSKEKLNFNRVHHGRF